MQHIVIEGSLGAGKTFMMTLLANWWKEETIRQGGTAELFSNYGMKGGKDMIDYTDWYEVAKAQGSILCLDEAHITASSRSWGQFGQQILTDVLMYVRKMKCVIIYATPSISNLDSRIRQIVEVLVRVRHEPKGYRMYFYDYQTNQLLRTVFFSEAKAERVYKLNLYDTYAFVRSFPMPNNERQANEFWDKLENIHVEARGGVLV